MYMYAIHEPTGVSIITQELTNLSTSHVAVSHLADADGLVRLN